MSLKQTKMEPLNSLKKPRQSMSSVPPPLPPLPDKLSDTLTPNFVAKSPPSDKYQTLSHPLTSTLKTRCSEDTSPSSNDKEGNVLLICGGIQMLCGLMMGVFGVLTLLHDAAMAEFGGGVWSGAVAMSCGLVGVMTGLRGCYNPGSKISSLGVTIYLALCLVTIAVCNLGLVLTSTGLVRDAQRPNYYIPADDDPSGLPEPEIPLTNWAPVLANLGLLLTTTLLCVTTVVAVWKVYRTVCPCTAPHHRLLGSDSPASSSYSSGSKQRLVKHWLGQQAAMYPSQPTPHGLLVYPPSLIMEGNQIYTVPSSLGYPQCITPIPYAQRRRSTPHRTPRDRDASTLEDSRRKRRRQRGEAPPDKKKREVTEEDLEKTYTGLDREIAEEFISISMQHSNGSDSMRRDDKPRQTLGRDDKVIGCITPM